MASFSSLVRNRDDVGVRGSKKKDPSPYTTVKIPSYDPNFVSLLSEIEKEGPQIGTQ